MSSSAITASFPKFGDLPKEIRLSIWEFAIPDYRIVHIMKDVKTFAVKSRTRIPNLLHVNKESFAVASKVYRPAFRCCKPGHSEPDEDTPYVWFDFERDFVLLDDQILENFPAVHKTFQSAGSYNYEDWFPVDESRCIKNIASYVSLVDHSVQQLLTFFTGLRRWFEVNEIMGSANTWKESCLRGAPFSDERYHDKDFWPSYNLSFWDVRGEETIEILNSIRLFQQVHESKYPILVPNEVFFHSARGTWQIPRPSAAVDNNHVLSLHAEDLFFS